MGGGARLSGAVGAMQVTGLVQALEKDVDRCKQAVCERRRRCDQVELLKKDQ